jgi:energy-converting hydrogenase Eha subunit E
MNTLAPFLMGMGAFIALLGILGLAPGPEQEKPLKAMLAHPLHNRIRPSSVEKGAHVSELALSAPYLYLIGICMAVVGLGLLLLTYSL